MGEEDWKVEERGAIAFLRRPEPDEDGEVILSVSYGVQFCAAG